MATAANHIDADRVRRAAFDALSPAEKTDVLLAVAGGAGVLLTGAALVRQVRA